MKSHNFTIGHLVQFSQKYTETHAQYAAPELTKEFDDSDFMVQQVYQTLQNLDRGKARMLMDFLIRCYANLHQCLLNHFDVCLIFSLVW